MLIARTKFDWFPPIVLMPDWENPTAESSSCVQRLRVGADRRAGRRERVQDRQDVLRRIRIRLGGLAEQLPVLPNGRHPRIDCEQHVVRIGDRLADALTLAAH